MMSIETTKTNHYFRALAVLAAGLLAALTKPAHASTTFTVNSTGDGSDKEILFVDDLLCDVDPFATGSQCTLRAAIEEANETAGADTIEFDIPGSGVKTIKPKSRMPFITEQVSIDGYSQPGSSPNTLANGTDAKIMIELTEADGVDLPEGLAVVGSNIVVKGLAINGFKGHGIQFGLPATGSRVEGNFIGTGASGTQDLGNGSTGVLVLGSNSSVGGSTPDKRNVISGNADDGVNISGGSSNNKVQGNLIGTKKDGTTALGNDGEGVDIFNATGNTVGGATPAEANTVAFNGDDGVQVGADASLGNRILRNSIFSNGKLGIELGFGSDGSTPNDPGDADGGPNRLQNFPVLTSAKTSGSETSIQGSLDSAPNKTFKVQFFSNPGNGDEGKAFVGQKNVTTGSNGKVSFTFKPSNKVPVGRTITATATDPGGNTSEFSAARTVSAQ